MLNISCKNIVKYILAALVLIGILHYIPESEMSTANIFKVALVVLLFLIFVDLFSETGPKTENMDIIASNDTVPQWFDRGITGYQPDYYKSGFEFNTVQPDYYERYGNRYIENPITIDMLPCIIDNDERRIMREEDDYENLPIPY